MVAPKNEFLVPYCTVCIVPFALCGSQRSAVIMGGSPRAAAWSVTPSDLRREVRHGIWTSKAYYEESSLLFSTGVRQIILLYLKVVRNWRLK